MARVKSQKIGDSLGIVLPEDVLSRLQVKEGSELFLHESTDGSFWLSSFNLRNEQKMSKAQEIMSRYRDTLHELAK